VVLRSGSGTGSAHCDVLKANVMLNWVGSTRLAGSS
jgi:hypothetical protein